MTVLDDIIAQKKEEIAAMPDTRPEPTERRFIAGLRKRLPCVIAEVKPRSPSAGMLMQPRDVPRTVGGYNKCAQAISVLCDHAFFGGGYDLLAGVRHMTELPLLAKEFILDAKQIRAARAAGADAVLLIAAILDKETLAALAREAAALGMGVLVELHDAAELEKVPALGADVMAIGINNRNLATLAIDLDTASRVAPAVRERFAKHLLIAESGVKTKADFQRLRPSVDGFLIGTGLLTGTMPPHFPL